MLRLNLKPTDSQLRQFGFAAAVVIPLASGLWLRDGAAFAWSLLPAAVCGVTGTLRPGWLRPLFIALSLITLPIGIVLGELILLAVYFLLVVPTGLLLKWSGRDPLQLRLPQGATSAWLPRRRPTSVRQYYRQS